MDYLSLCLICKDENDYLPEWLNYHILMGVDRFYIYDNESRVSLRETLKEYIERGWVVVVDIPGKAMQLYAYDHCLQTFGAQTFWLGFIDTDEFLVPKTTLDLKELLREYEQYAGLAVSSLFFGSNGNKNRPKIGQIAAYTRRTRGTNKEYELVKSIIQPRLVLMPNSPHDFIYKENTWCVNEGYLRVDYQCFPSHTEKIQLNHYFCRSKHEMELKLGRGNSQAVAWPRKRFDMVNLTAIYEDTSILQNLDTHFQRADIGYPGLAAVVLLERMAVLARTKLTLPLEITLPTMAHSFRPEFADWLELKKKWDLANERGDVKQAFQLELSMLQIHPHHVHLYVVLAISYLKLGDPDAAWRLLTRAWKLAPDNNYNIYCGMVLYFQQVENYSMAERTCRLILELAPYDMSVLGLLTNSLIGQGRYEEAFQVGGPVLELAGTPDWDLQNQMGIILVKKLAGYLLEKKDYAGAAQLWGAGVKCQPGDVDVLLELSKSLLLAGDMTGARHRLAEAQVLAPQNEAVLELLRADALAARQADTTDRTPRVKRRR